MRLLYLVDRFWPYIGGIEMVSASLVLELQRRGHEVTVVSDDWGGRLPPQDSFRGVPVRRFDILASSRQARIADIRTAQSAVAELRRRIRPDVVHGALGGAIGRYAAAPEEQYTAPVLLSCHGPWPPRHPVAEAGFRRAVKRADWVTACSESTLAWVVREWEADRSRASVLANGLDPRTATPRLPTFEPPVLLCVARLSPEKGVDIALSAFVQVRRHLPTARLLIAGDGPERTSLEQEAAGLGLGRAVEFLGWVPPPDIPALLDRSSIVLLPSRSEGFGLVAVEAAFACRPIVASSVGGLAENLRHRETALLVPTEDPGAMAAAVLEIVAAPDRAVRMADAARRTATERWTVARYADGCEELYERLRGRRAKLDRIRFRRPRLVSRGRALLRDHRAWLPTTPESSSGPLLPTTQLAMFLRAALLTGEPARAALHEWLDLLDGSTAGLRRPELAPPRLLPLLGDGVRRNRCEVPAPLESLLRAATTRETARAGRAASACRDVLAALDDAGVRTIVLRGVALAHTAYLRAGLRHCHDLDLLVDPDDGGRAHDALTTRGHCRRTSDRLVHRSNFPVELHTQPTASRARFAPEDLWERSVTTSLAGAPARTLDTSDELLALCVHAAATPSRSPQWAADAMMLLRAAPPDWEAVLARARQLRASVSCALLLGWLMDELSAPVPEWVIRRLEATGDEAAADLSRH